MSRLVWLGAGVGLGVAGVRRLGTAARAVAPGQVHGTVGDLERRARAFAEDVRVTMEEREADLLRALGIPGADVTDDRPGTRRR